MRIVESKHKEQEVHNGDVADKTSVSDTCDSGLSGGIPDPDRHKTAVLSRKSGGGLVILIVAGGIIFYIYKMQWTNLFLSVLVGVLVLAVMFCATIIEMTMERICTAIGDFIRY